MRETKRRSSPTWIRYSLRTSSIGRRWSRSRVPFSVSRRALMGSARCPASRSPSNAWKRFPTPRHSSTNNCPSLIERRSYLGFLLGREISAGRVQDLRGRLVLLCERDLGGMVDRPVDEDSDYARGDDQ